MNLCIHVTEYTDRFQFSIKNLIKANLLAIGFLRVYIYLLFTENELSMEREMRKKTVVELQLLKGLI